jgi:hypothetical protein
MLPTIEIIDYNGQGEWASAAILQRYIDYRTQFHVNNTIDLTPQGFTEGNKRWIYAVMDKVIVGIKQGDAACKLIGIEFIEQDQKFPFGKILKSNTARALRQTNLDEEDKERIRNRLVSMLLAGNIPREYQDYAKLLKKIGFEGNREILEARINRSNPYVMKYFNYLVNSY